MEFGEKHTRLYSDAPRKSIDYTNPPALDKNPLRHQLVSDIRFLCKTLKQADVLYLSSASARYIGILASLFPYLTFYLYQKDILPPLPSNVKYCGQMLEDNEMERWHNHALHDGLYLISNMRVLRESGEAEVTATMDWQMKLLETIQPVRWSVDFRAPYRQGVIRYLKGDLLINPFGKPDSPSLRLEGNEWSYECGYIAYDMHKIREIMCHHNTVIRPRLHMFAGAKDKAGSCCYDWAAFYHALKIYAPGFGEKELAALAGHIIKACR